MSNILIEYFGCSSAKKSAGLSITREKFGNKGATLMELSDLGIPVPPGFVISTDLFRYYSEHGNIDVLSMDSAIGVLESTMQAKFGGQSPLLISVRSGAAVSMPGMMDTILNVGINDDTVIALAQSMGEISAYDSYRRLISMYSTTVLGIDHRLFDDILQRFMLEAGVSSAIHLPAQSFIELIAEYKALAQAKSASGFPQNVNDQLRNAIIAVLDSWMSARAQKYRAMNNLSATLGTAITIQSMVFGNANERSGTGIVFTRNPSTGDDILFGEFIFQGQGEDVVSGAHFTSPLTKVMAKSYSAHENILSMEEVFPKQMQELTEICSILEGHYKDMQDIEFTIDSNKLWILQSRRGKRSADASVKIAHDMCVAGKIDMADAISQIDARSLEKLMHPTLNKLQGDTVIAHGLAASPGAASGMVALTSAQAEMMVQHSKNVILVREETSPDDIAGMAVARGILTKKGGMTSHAAVVARGIGKPCVCGVMDLEIDLAKKMISFGDKVFNAGDVITIDGASGEIFAGAVEMCQSEMNEDFYQIMQWAKSLSQLKVRANADTDIDAKNAIQLGAIGIGLCRTEHMFFEKSKIFYMRQMILANSNSEREAALAKLVDFQQNDFHAIFEKCLGLPVTIRLLDPPLHEFLPRNEADLTAFIEMDGRSSHNIKAKIDLIAEHNPMLGHRGCRIAITYPEVYKMQVRAMFLAILNLIRQGVEPRMLQPEIMIPLVAYEEELRVCKKIVEDEIAVLIDKYPELRKVPYKFGAMIETASAALNADKLAHLCDFFSFGTNDLTQTTLGISRDDSGGFISCYLNDGLITKDPFISLDIESVGVLIRIAVDKARSVKPKIKLGVCGEHAGDEASIAFFNELRLDYISCSPFRIPIAMIAAAQAEIYSRR